MLTTNRPVLSTDQARDLHAHVAGGRDRNLYTWVSLLLLTGQRPGEVASLHKRDHLPGPPPRLRTGPVLSPRTICIAPFADAVLRLCREQSWQSDDMLMPQISTTWLVQRVRGAAADTGLEAGVHDLRRAAIVVAIQARLPMQQVEAYFGLSQQPGRKNLVGLPEGYDVEIAGLLEEAFA